MGVYWIIEDSILINFKVFLKKRKRILYILTLAYINKGDKMQVLIYRPEKVDVEVDEVKTFTDLRKIVGGFVCVATKSNGKVLLCNEDGLNLKLPPNPHFPGLVGNLVVCSEAYDDLPYGEDGLW
jgi:hypothetical protein